MIHIWRKEPRTVPAKKVREEKSLWTKMAYKDQTFGFITTIAGNVPGSFLQC